MVERGRGRLAPTSPPRCAGGRLPIQGRFNALFSTFTPAPPDLGISGHNFPCPFPSSLTFLLSRSGPHERGWEEYGTLPGPGPGARAVPDLRQPTRREERWPGGRVTFPSLEGPWGGHPWAARDLMNGGTFHKTLVPVKSYLFQAGGLQVLYKLGARSHPDPLRGTERRGPEK